MPRKHEAWKGVIFRGNVPEFQDSDAGRENKSAFLVDIASRLVALLAMIPKTTNLSAKKRAAEQEAVAEEEEPPPRGPRRKKAKATTKSAAAGAAADAADARELYKYERQEARGAPLALILAHCSEF